MKEMMSVKQSSVSGQSRRREAESLSFQDKNRDKEPCRAFLDRTAEGGCQYTFLIILLPPN
jgi:hypothetical protein